jgi:hypothetical protein
MLASYAADHDFEPWSYPAKDYTIGICGFHNRYTVLRCKSKDWLTLNHDNVCDGATCVVFLFCLSSFRVIDSGLSILDCMFGFL